MNTRTHALSSPAALLRARLLVAQDESARAQAELAELMSSPSRLVLGQERLRALMEKQSALALSVGGMMLDLLAESSLEGLLRALAEGEAPRATLIAEGLSEQGAREPAVRLAEGAPEQSSAAVFAEPIGLSEKAATSPTSPATSPATSPGELSKEPPEGVTACAPEESSAAVFAEPIGLSEKAATSPTPTPAATSPASPTSPNLEGLAPVVRRVELPSGFTPYTKPEPKHPQEPAAHNAPSAPGPTPQEKALKALSELNAPADIWTKEAFLTEYARLQRLCDANMVRAWRAQGTEFERLVGLHLAQRVRHLEQLSPALRPIHAQGGNAFGALLKGLADNMEVRLNASNDLSLLRSTLGTGAGWLLDAKRSFPRLLETLKRLGALADEPEAHAQGAEVVGVTRAEEVQVTKIGFIDLGAPRPVAASVVASASPAAEPAPSATAAPAPSPSQEEPLSAQASSPALKLEGLKFGQSRFSEDIRFPIAAAPSAAASSAELNSTYAKTLKALSELSAPVEVSGQQSFAEEHKRLQRLCDPNIMAEWSKRGDLKRALTLHLAQRLKHLESLPHHMRPVHAQGGNAFMSLYQQLKQHTRLELPVAPTQGGWLRAAQLGYEPLVVLIKQAAESPSSASVTPESLKDTPSAQTLEKSVKKATKKAAKKALKAAALSAPSTLATADRAPEGARDAAAEVADEVADEAADEAADETTELITELTTEPEVVERARLIKKHLASKPLKVALVGGDRFINIISRLKEELPKAEITWTDTRPGSGLKQLDSLCKRIHRGTVDVVLVLKSFVSHRVTDKINAAHSDDGRCEWELIRCGYGIAQARIALGRIAKRLEHREHLGGAQG